MVHYKLYYFNARGRAEPLRLIFAQSGHTFDDVRFERDQWPQYKIHSPTGQAPYLEVSEAERLGSAQRKSSAIKTEYNEHNFSVSQSAAISRLLARRFHLYGHGDREHAEVDQYVDQAIDIQDEIFKVHFMPNPEAKKEAEEKLHEDTLPVKLSVFEQRLGHTGKDHLVPSGRTIADLYLFSILESLGPNREQLLAKFPNISRLENSVRNDPKISEYLAERVHTPF